MATPKEARREAVKAAVENHFAKGLFVSLALMLLLSQIPLWISPSRTLQLAFTKHEPSGLALAQEVLIAIANSILMVFVAAISLYTAFRPRRLIISIFTLLTLLFFGAAAYQIHNLGGSNTVIAALILNLIFFLLTLIALIKSEPAAIPSKPHIMVRVPFLLIALAFGGIGVFHVFAPETALDHATTTQPEDAYHVSQLKIILVLNGFLYLFISVVAFFSAFQPDRSVCIIFATLLFATLVFGGHAVENRDVYALNYDSAIAMEVTHVILFVLVCVATVLVPGGNTSYNEMVDKV